MKKIDTAFSKPTVMFIVPSWSPLSFRFERPTTNILEVSCSPSVTESSWSHRKLRAPNVVTWASIHFIYFKKGGTWYGAPNEKTESWRMNNTYARHWLFIWSGRWRNNGQDIFSLSQRSRLQSPATLLQLKRTFTVMYLRFRELIVWSVAILGVTRRFISKDPKCMSG